MKNVQKTIRNQIELKGVGLHSGKPVRLVMIPSAPNTGVRFLRSDIENSPKIAAHYSQILNTQLATTIGKAGIQISTVEHLMAALQFHKIDNVLVAVSGPELPIMDGSSLLFCQAIEKAGIQKQNQTKPLVLIKKKIEVKVNEKWATVEPASRLEIEATIDWDHPAIGFQKFKYIEGVTALSEIAGARTFGFTKDFEMLKRAGLARGASLENVVALNESEVLNADGLRYPDEFVRHKVLDAMGDFKLAGIEICGKFRLHRSGHDLHASILKEIFNDEANFEIVGDSAHEGLAVGGFRAALLASLIS